MGLLGRIRAKSEKISGEKSSSEIKDDISNKTPEKIKIKSSEDIPVSYTHLRAHETPEHRVCRRVV